MSSTAAKEIQIATENFSRYAYIRDNGHLEFIRKANKCDDYFAGLQWDPILEKRLTRQGKPALTINKILATMATVMGEQLRNRADISFKPLKYGTPETASILNKVYIQIANNNKLDWVEANVADDGFITSRGFYDVRVEFDDQMQGEVRIKHLNPRNVGIDPDADDYDPATWKDVVVTKWLTLNDIEVVYGKRAANQLKSGGSSLPYEYDAVERTHQTFGGFVVAPTAESDFDGDYALRKYRVIERQYKKVRMKQHFVDPDTGDLRPVPENWSTRKVKDFSRKMKLQIVRKKVEQIRWTVTCAHVVLHDEWSPYKHFTVVPYFPFFRHGRTIGVVENLLGSQDLLNKTASQELHIVNTTANSGWKVKSGSLTNMTSEELEERGAETGLVVELDDVNNMEKISPNTVPTGLDRISFKADEFIKEISGVSDSQRGMDRADVAAKAIQAKQAAGSINLAKPLDNLARTRHLLAARVLDLVQTYYTEERVLQITGSLPNAETEEVTINQQTPEGKIINDLTIGEYEVVVTTAPAKNNHQETQMQEALQLREIGIKVPDRVLLKNSSLDDRQEIIESMQQSPEQAQMEEQLQQLELQEKQVELAEKQNKAMLNRANAMLAMKRASKVEAETAELAQEMSAPGGEPLDQSKLLDYNLRKEDMEQRRQIEQERLEIERQRARFEQAMKIRENLEQKAQQQNGGQQDGGR